jgi:uncharacterized membrane protein
MLAALSGAPALPAADGMRYERIAYPKAVQTKIVGINDQGTIIGSYTLDVIPPHPPGAACIPTTHTTCVTSLTDAFVYANKTFSRLRGPEGAEIRFVAINNHNQVLLNDTHGKGNNWFLYSIDKDQFIPIGLLGQMTTPKGVKTIHLHNLLGLNDKGEIIANADAGHVIGKPALGAPGSLTPPTEPGEFTQILNCEGGGSTDLNGINAQDQVVGTCHLKRYTVDHVLVMAFTYVGGAFKSIGESDAIVTSGTAINNSGVITGFYQPQNTSFSRSFIYDGAKFTELRVKFSPNGNPAVIRAYGINNQGQVVGTVQGGLNNGSIDGFLATPQ